MKVSTIKISKSYLYNNNFVTLSLPEVEIITEHQEMYYVIKILGNKVICNYMITKSQAEYRAKTIFNRNEVKKYEINDVRITIDKELSNEIYTIIDNLKILLIDVFPFYLKTGYVKNDVIIYKILTMLSVFVENEKEVK